MDATFISKLQRASLTYHLINLQTNFKPFYKNIHQIYQTQCYIAKDHPDKNPHVSKNSDIKFIWFMLSKIFVEPSHG